MKQALLSFLFAAIISLGHSQSSQQAYCQWADSVFAGLDEKYVTTGILADKGQLHKIFDVLFFLK